MKRGEVAGFSRFVSIRDFRLNGDQCFDLEMEFSNLPIQLIQLDRYYKLYV